MAEKLVLDKRVREVGARERDDGIHGARAQAMNHPRDQLFSGSGLSSNQNRDVAGRDALGHVEHLRHGLRGGDDLGHEPRLHLLGAQPGCFFERAMVLMAAFENDAQIHQARRACQHFVCALFEEIERRRALLGFINHDNWGRELGLGYELKKAESGRQLEFTPGGVQIKENRVNGADGINVDRKTAATFDVESAA